MRSGPRAVTIGKRLIIDQAPESSRLPSSISPSNPYWGMVGSWLHPPSSSSGIGMWERYTCSYVKSSIAHPCQRGKSQAVLKDSEILKAWNYV